MGGFSLPSTAATLARPAHFLAAAGWLTHRANGMEIDFVSANGADALEPAPFPDAGSPPAVAGHENATKNEPKKRSEKTALRYYCQLPVCVRKIMQTQMVVLAGISIRFVSKPKMKTEANRAWRRVFRSANRG